MLRLWFSSGWSPSDPCMVFKALALTQSEPALTPLSWRCPQEHKICWLNSEGCRKLDCACLHGPSRRLFSEVFSLFALRLQQKDQVDAGVFWNRSVIASNTAMKNLMNSRNLGTKELGLQLCIFCCHLYLCGLFRVPMSLQ